jgi:hypothetical protein
MGSNSAEAFTVAGPAAAESLSLRPVSRKSPRLFAKVYDVKNSAVLTGLAALLQAVTDGPHLERATISSGMLSSGNWTTDGMRIS